MRVWIFLVSAAALSGCVSFTGYAPQPASWPLQAKGASAPSVSLYCDWHDWGIGSLGPQGQKAPCDDVVVKTYEESGLFSRVLNGAKGGDFRVEMTRTELRDPPDIGKVVAASCTLLLYPVQFGEDVYLTSTVFDSHDERIHQIMTMEHSVSYMALWNGIFPGVFVPESTRLRPVVKAAVGELARRGLPRS